MHIYSVWPKTLRCHFSFKSIPNGGSRAHNIFPVVVNLPRFSRIHSIIVEWSVAIYFTVEHFIEKALRFLKKRRKLHQNRTSKADAICCWIIRTFVTCCRGGVPRQASHKTRTFSASAGVPHAIAIKPRKLIGEVYTTFAFWKRFSVFDPINSLAARGVEGVRGKCHCPKFLFRL